MKTYALIAGGRVAELLPETIEIEGISYGPADRYPPETMSACVALSAAQAKKVEAGWTYDGLTFTAPAQEAAAPAAPARTYKTEIWRRCTDVEAEQLDSALDQAPAKLRRLWTDSQVIMHEAAEFPALRDAVASVVGAARADELLAASYYGG